MISSSKKIIVLLKLTDFPNHIVIDFVEKINNLEILNNKYKKNGNINILLATTYWSNPIGYVYNPVNNSLHDPMINLETSPTKYSGFLDKLDHLKFGDNFYKGDFKEIFEMIATNLELSFKAKIISPEVFNIITAYEKRIHEEYLESKKIELNRQVIISGNDNLKLLTKLAEINNQWGLCIEKYLKEIRRIPKQYPYPTEGDNILDGLVSTIFFTKKSNYPLYFSIKDYHSYLVNIQDDLFDRFEKDLLKIKKTIKFKCYFCNQEIDLKIKFDNLLSNHNKSIFNRDDLHVTGLIGTCNGTKYNPCDKEYSTSNDFDHVNFSKKFNTELHIYLNYFNECDVPFNSRSMHNVKTLINVKWDKMIEKYVNTYSK